MTFFPTRYLGFFCILSLSLLFLGCTNNDELPIYRECNGIESLCAKTYNEVVFVTTHNSHAYAPLYHEYAANQSKTIPEQLADGVRGINLKVYLTADEACGTEEDMYVYHGFPGLGCEPFSLALSQIKAFLDIELNEVITLIIEGGGASIFDIAESFEEAGLTPFLHQQEFGEPWPLLNTLINTNRRLVVFTGWTDSNLVPGFHHNWSYMIDTYYQAESASDFSCDYDRGTEAADLFMLNHFISNPVPQSDSAAIINKKAVLANRINECKQATGRTPNFIHLDFYDLGDAIEIADSLNSLF